MIMRKIIFFQAMALTLSLTTAGCFKDDSTTQKIDMPDIAFDLENPQSTLSVLAYAGDEFELEIPVIWNDKDPDVFDFRWTMDNEVISTERILRKTFMQIGSYYMAFQVIERATGLAIGTRINLMVGSKYLLGWLILSDKGGRTALDFIHVDTHELYPDIYNSLHPDDPLGSEPLKIIDNCKDDYDQIILLQKGGQGALALDGRTFEKVIRIEEEFVGEKYPYPGFTPVDAYFTNYSSLTEILLSDKGEAYARNNNGRKGIDGFQTSQYPSLPLEYPDGKDLVVTYYTSPKYSYFFTLFDGLNNRWLTVRKTNSITYTEVMLPLMEKEFDIDDPDLPVEGPEFFDFCEGMPPHIKLVFAQNSYEYSASNNFINILKDTQTGKYYYQRSTLNYERSPRERVVVANPIQREFATGYPLDDDSRFCMLHGLVSRYDKYPHIFFTAGNKLYFYREQNNNIFLLKDFDMVADPPKGKVVAIMQSPGPAPDYHQKISVAFSDGHFFILNCTTVINDIVQGAIDANNPDDAAKIEIAHYSGLGEIKDAIFKYGRWQNWVSELERER